MKKIVILVLCAMLMSLHTAGPSKDMAPSLESKTMLVGGGIILFMLLLWSGQKQAKPKPTDAVGFWKSTDHHQYSS